MGIATPGDFYKLYALNPDGADDGGDVKDLDPIELGEAGSLFLTRPRLSDYLPDAATIRRRAADIFATLMDGTLALDIARRYTLDNVEQAHQDLEERRTLGKPVIKIA